VNNGENDVDKNVDNVHNRTIFFDGSHWKRKT